MGSIQIKMVWHTCGKMDEYPTSHLFLFPFLFPLIPLNTQLKLCSPPTTMVSAPTTTTQSDWSCMEGKAHVSLGTQHSENIPPHHGYQEINKANICGPTCSFLATSVAFPREVSSAYCQGVEKRVLSRVSSNWEGTTSNGNPWKQTGRKTHHTSAL